MRQMLGIIAGICLLLSCSKDADDCGKDSLDNCFVSRSNLDLLRYGMTRDEVVSIIGNPFVEIPSHDHPFSINHCVWQRYNNISRNNSKNAFIIVDFIKDSLSQKRYSED